MAWRLIRNQKYRRIAYFIGIVLGLIAAYYSWDQARESAQEHDENQKVLLFDMGILMENQKILVENQKIFMENGTSQDIKDIKTKLVHDYNELLYSNMSVNPLTGQ